MDQHEGQTITEFSGVYELFLLCAFVCVQEDSRYEQVEDVRSQLKFFEQLDQLEKQKKEEQEREILMKAAKVSSPHAHKLTNTAI